MGGQVGPREGAQELALSDRRPRRTSRVQGGEGKLEGPPRPGGTPGPPRPELEQREERRLRRGPGWGHGGQSTVGLMGTAGG